MLRESDINNSDHKAGTLTRDPQETEQVLPNDIEHEECQGQDNDRQDHDDRSPDQLSLRWPSHLRHFGFDRDQKVGETGPIDKAKAKPQTGSQQPHRGCSMDPRAVRNTTPEEDA